MERVQVSCIKVGDMIKLFDDLSDPREIIAIGPVGKKSIKYVVERADGSGLRPQTLLATTLVFRMNEVSK